MKAARCFPQLLWNEATIALKSSEMYCVKTRFPLSYSVCWFLISQRFCSCWGNFLFTSTWYFQWSFFTIFKDIKAFMLLQTQWNVVSFLIFVGRCFHPLNLDSNWAWHCQGESWLGGRTFTNKIIELNDSTYSKGFSYLFIFLFSFLTLNELAVVAEKS